MYLPVATEVSPGRIQAGWLCYNDFRSAGADWFRWVGIRLKNLQTARGLKTLLITSPLPGDGKSTACLNLATVLSENGKQSVLLVEADTYRPSLVNKFGDSGHGPGCTDAIGARVNPDWPFGESTRWASIYCRRASPRGMATFSSRSTLSRSLIKYFASSAFDWILIDSPPSTPIAEILSLKAQADATLLVARAGHTPREAIGETARNLGRDHILGIILNGVVGLNRVYSKYYGYVKPDSPAKEHASKTHTAWGWINLERKVTILTSMLWWIVTVAWAVLIFSLSTRNFTPDFSKGLLSWMLQLFHLQLSVGRFDLVHMLSGS